MRNTKKPVTCYKFVYENEVVNTLVENREMLIKVKLTDSDIWIKGLVFLKSGIVLGGSFVGSREFKVSDVHSVRVDGILYSVLGKDGIRMNDEELFKKRDFCKIVEDILNKIAIGRDSDDVQTLEFYSDTLTFLENVIKSKKVKFREEEKYLSLIHEGRFLITN